MRDMWRPTKREHAEGKFPPVIRTKVSKSSIHVWGEDKTPLAPGAIVMWMLRVLRIVMVMVNTMNAVCDVGVVGDISNRGGSEYYGTCK